MKLEADSEAIDPAGLLYIEQISSNKTEALFITLALVSFSLHLYGSGALAFTF